MKSYCLTDVGLKRENNQDFVYAQDHSVGPLPSLYAVADGMGGHKAGDLASRLCVETLVREIGESHEKKTVQVLTAAIRAANRAVLERAAADPGCEGMGTTLVLGVLDGMLLTVANIGDSRLYVIDDENIDQITHDHSLVEELVRSGRLSRERMREAPNKNIITRAIGGGSGNPDVKIDFFDVAMHPGDLILLCSDGLSNMLEDREIFRIVHREDSLEKTARRLVDEANRSGGKDNISVVLVKV